MKIGNFETKSAEDIKPLEDIRAMFVGRKGSGKSISAVSLIQSDPDEKRKALVIDIDKRAQSLRGKPRVDIIDFGMKDGFQELQDLLYNLSVMVDKGTYQEQYCVTLLSSITSLQVFLLRDSLRHIGVGGDGDKVAGAQKIGGMYIPGMRNYLYVSNGIEDTIIQQLFYLPGNLIIEAHVVNHYNEKGSIDGEAILATNKTAEKIPTFFNEVWKFEKRSSGSDQLPPKFVCVFNSTLAMTTYKQLPKEVDITGKPFYPILKGLLTK